MKALIIEDEFAGRMKLQKIMEGVCDCESVENGNGMSPEVLRQALNPFFTTKPPGSGTGVGLTIVERTIKRHGGKIKLSSEENVGTTAIMTLPIKSVVQST